MPLKPCLVCGALSHRSHCPRHRPSRRSAARGSGGKQATFRRRVLRQYGERCVRCGATEGIEAHHVHPLADGGTHDGPGVPLCGECHRRERR